jgi:hypothetical protein
MNKYAYYTSKFHEVLDAVLPFIVIYLVVSTNFITWLKANNKNFC